MFIKLVLECPKGEVYTPCCRCENVEVLDAHRAHIICSDFSSMTEIAQVFKKTTRSPLIESFFLTLPDNGDDELLGIPENFLARHRIGSFIGLECAEVSLNRTIPMKLSIHPDAFDASKDTLQNIYVANCDLDNLDFLAGFRNLTTFHFNFNGHGGDVPGVEFDVGWPGWPFVPTMSRPLLPLLSTKLEGAVFDGIGFGDEVADQIVLWLLQSSSETLLRLVMVDTRMTRIPKNVSSFKQLKEYHFKCREPAIIEVITSERPLVKKRFALVGSKGMDRGLPIEYCTHREEYVLYNQTILI